MNRDYLGRRVALHLIGRAQAADPYGPGKRAHPEQLLPTPTRPPKALLLYDVDSLGPLVLQISEG